MYLLCDIIAEPRGCFKSKLMCGICSFKQIASSRPLLELRTPEENAEAAALAAAALEPAPVEDKVVDGPPGDEEGSKVEKPPGLTEADELARYIGIRDALYKRAKEMDVRIRDYETAIRRPYFHVKPLDDTQLANWHRYLDLVEKDGDFDKVRFMTRRLST